MWFNRVKSKISEYDHFFHVREVNFNFFFAYGFFIEFGTLFDNIIARWFNWVETKIWESGPIFLWGLWNRKIIFIYCTIFLNCVTWFLLSLQVIQIILKEFSQFLLNGMSNDPNRPIKNRSGVERPWGGWGPETPHCNNWTRTILQIRVYIVTLGVSCSL